MEQIAGRNAVVTGGATGIGRSIALSLAREGANVVVADVDLETAEATADEVRALGVTAVAVRTDVSKHDSVEELADAAYAALGSVEILVNNAGVTWSPFRPIWEASMGDYEWIIGVNFWGVVHGFHVFLPRMIEQPGEKHILSTSSGSSFASVPGTTAYSAAKMAVDGFSLCALEECRSHGIGVSVLYPGRVPTRIQSSERLRPVEDRAESRDVVAWDDPSYDAGNASLAPPLDADEVGPMAIEGIKANEFYILTHPAPADTLRRRVEGIISAGGIRTPGVIA